MDSHKLRRQWAERSGEFSPAYYAYYGPDERSEAVRRLLDSHLDRDREPAVLELGCSSGRHLVHLLEAGYTDLTGIEINEEAFDVMSETYPDLAATGTFYHDAIEDVIGDFEDDRFDAVYSVETLQHLHPDHEWVFEEMARIAKTLIVTVEIEEASDSAETDSDVNYVAEDIPLYYRDWNRVFTGLGLREVETEDVKRDTIRAFRVD